MACNVLYNYEFTKGKTEVKYEKFKYRRFLNIKERTAQFDLHEKVSDNKIT